MKRLLGLIVLIGCLLTIAASPSKPSAEYKIENGVSESKINALAADGWDVVATGNYNGGMPYVILRRTR